MRLVIADLFLLLLIPMVSSYLSTSVLAGRSESGMTDGIFDFECSLRRVTLTSYSMSVAQRRGPMLGLQESGWYDFIAMALMF